jgi:site-specific DNA recombinase
MAANTQRRNTGPRRVGTLALKGLLFDANGTMMTPTFAYGRGKKLYRYYAAAPRAWGAERKKGDCAIRRIQADAIESVVRDALERLVRRPGAIAPAPRRVDVYEHELHICVPRAALFGSHADPARELERLCRRLVDGERAVLDGHDVAALRIILPLRLQLRGGRTWMMAPDGRAAVQAGVDKTLVGALRAAHRLAAQSGLKDGPAGGEQSLPRMSTYERRLCGLAFLAPDIQAAILAGRQPLSLNLKALIKTSLPVEWSDQRVALAFPTEVD